MVPCICHDFTQENWRAICRILIKGFMFLKYFPIKLNCGSLIAAIFGEKYLDQDILPNTFVDFVIMSISWSLQLKRPLSTLKVKMFDILSTLNSKTLPKSRLEFQVILLEIVQRAGPKAELRWGSNFQSPAMLNDVNSHRRTKYCSCSHWTQPQKNWLKRLNS